MDKIKAEDLTIENIPVLCKVGLADDVLLAIDEKIEHWSKLRAAVGGNAPKRVRITAEDGKTHGQALLDALETFGKDGASSKQLQEALVTQNHPMNASVFHSTMQVLLKEQIVRKVGEKGASVYKAKANSRKLLDERTARRGRQSKSEPAVGQ